MSIRQERRLKIGILFLCFLVMMPLVRNQPGLIVALWATITVIVSQFISEQVIKHLSGR